MLTLECYRPVPVGTMVEIQGVVLHATRAYLVVGLIGTPLNGEEGPWMDALLGFVQVDEEGQPAPLPIEATVSPIVDEQWQDLHKRLEKLLRMRSPLASMRCRLLPGCFQGASGVLPLWEPGERRQVHGDVGLLRP